MIRAIRPVDPPGANGTTKVTGRLGYWLALSWAWAVGASTQPITAATNTAFIGDLSKSVVTLTQRDPDEIPDGTLQCNMRYCTPNTERNETRPAMRMYSPEELDVMAEAFDRALDKAHNEICSTAVTQRLVQEIGWAVANGIRDEDLLANTALERTNIDETPAI